ncbi:unnamed protein product [Caenorhabditis angaria]|uniref:Activin types I and II receptor domain-containing protein n=1 Tax=Caenorhabditis angaria TaxID=860376 RepID=A0A9P1I6C6_9PELO|nr:unnamed protein product [Caenorhabditis angaria]
MIFFLLFVVFVTRNEALRCQCTTDKGGVPCYKSWCQVYNNGTRVAACAMIRIGSIQHFACAHVSKDSDDSCTVVNKNGREAHRRLENTCCQGLAA